MTRLSFAVCYFCLTALGQMSFDPRATTVYGRVSGNSSQLQSYAVQIEALNERMRRYSVTTDIGGDYRITGVTAGEYRITVADGNGTNLYQGFVSAVENGPGIDVHLTDRAVSRPVSGVISLAALSHKVPRKALQRLQAAAEAKRRGDLDQSVTELLKAVAIDPQFIEAHNNLAAAYIDLKRYEDASRELDVAAQLDPASPLIALNRAVCLTRTGQLSDAESSARRAIDLDRTSPRAHFALGVILFQQRKYTTEAVDNLKVGAQANSLGHLMAAQILATTRRTGEASEQLRHYLANGEVPNRPVVEKWLARLNDAPTAP